MPPLSRSVLSDLRGGLGVGLKALLLHGVFCASPAGALCLSCWGDPCIYSCQPPTPPITWAWLQSPAEASAGASVPSVGPGAVSAAGCSHIQGGPGSYAFKGYAVLRTGVWVVSGVGWGTMQVSL